MDPARTTPTVVVLAAAWIGLQVYDGVTGFRDVLVQRPVHLSFAIAIGVLATVRSGAASRALGAGLAVLAFAPSAYLALRIDSVLTRIPFVSAVTPLEAVLGVALLVSLLEATRRLLGLGLVGVTAGALAYGLAGPALPGIFRHPGLSPRTLLELNFLSSSGLFGIPLGVSSSVVFYFILFALALTVSGSGRLIMDLTVRAFGKRAGGPAKAAVLASAVTGSLNGSAVGNVMTTGVFTIPLMRDSGLPARTAAGIEAVASTGGQLVPPVMGAAAFTMAELTGIPYAEIVRAALVPSVLLYLSLLAIVHFESERPGVHERRRTLDIERVPLLPRLHLLAGPAVLAAALVAGYSLTMSALVATGATLVLGLVLPSTRCSLPEFVANTAQAAAAAARVALACGAAGIVIGIIVQTGLGLKLSAQLSGVASGSVAVALLIIMVGSIILGTGMPTTAAYVVSAMLLAPGLIGLGVPLLTAHMFVFMFAILAMVTPPIALAAYAAASIADCNANAVGFTAFRYSLTGFVVPFSLVYNVNLSPDAGVLALVPALLVAAVGVLLIGGGVAGYVRQPLRLWERAALVVAGTGLVLSLYVLTIVLVPVLLRLAMSRRRHAPQPVPPVR
jgi:TRAP transporter 4TM/12TM fusion protein